MAEGDPNPLDEDRLAELQAAYDPTSSSNAPDDWNQLDLVTRIRLERNRTVIDRLARLLPAGRAAGAHPPPTSFGRFRLRRQLGAGGCGVVFLADDPVLGREVALKLPRPDTLVNAELQRRFLREAQAAAVLSHPNLVPVYEANAIGSVCYTASEYCPGPDLAAWLNGAAGPVPVADAARAVVALAAGVGYAHRRGVVHRDVKPSNILLAPRPGAGPGPLAGYVPRLTDFGFAKLLEPDQAATQTGTLIGTPLYMAPEQAEGRTAAIGPPADVYALGVVLLELLAGRHPLAGCSTPEVLRRIVYEPMPRARALRPDVPRDLDAIGSKCLAKDPARRYPDGDALAADLARFLAGEPTVARPIRWPEQLGLWVRRNPAVTALTLAIVTALGLLAGVGWAYQSDLADRNTALRDALDREQAATADRERQRSLAVSRYQILRQQAYLSGIRAGAAAVDEGRLTDQLIGFRDAGGGEDDPRGFEWRFLDRLSRATRAWGRLPAPVWLSRITDDGRWVVGVGGREVRVWDARTGAVAAEWRHDQDLSNLAAVSPDGRYAAVIPARREAGALVFTSGQLRPRVLDRTRGQVLHQVEFAAGNRLLVRSVGSVSVFDAPTGRPVRELFREGYRAVSISVYNAGISIVIEFSLVGEKPAPHPVVEYDIDTSRETARGSLPGSFSSREVVSSCDGQLVLCCASSSDHVVVWDLAAEVERTRFAFPGGNPVKHVGRLADGRLAAATWSLGVDGARELTTAVWDPRTGRWESATQIPPSPVQWVQFRPDGWGLLVSGTDSSLVSVDLVRPERERGWPVAGRYEAWALAVAPDGRTIVTGGDDHAVRFWDAGTGARLAERRDHGSLVTKAVYAPGGAWVATGSFDGKVVVRDSNTGAPRKVLDHGKRVRTLAVSADGRALAAAGDGGQVSIWDVETGALRRRLSGPATLIHALTFTTDGTALLAAPTETELGWWEVSSGRPRREVNLGYRPSCLALAPDGKTLAVGYETGQIAFLDAADGRELRRAGGPYSRLTALAFSSDGKTLAAAAVDGSVRLWHAGTATELFAIHRGKAQINEVAFAPDGAYLAATGHDGRLVIWPATD